MTYFSAGTFAFLDDLSGTRDKDWFQANRARYEGFLLEPMRDLVTAVAPRLQSALPDLECRPQVDKTLTRINRDLRFARGRSPYKDHMLALFYREGRKKQDPQLFVGLQPQGAWVGLYLAPGFLAGDAPMAKAVSERPEAVATLGKQAGLCEELSLAACSRYGAVDRLLDASDASNYLAGPHLCAMKAFSADEVAAQAQGFSDTAADILVRLLPLRACYLEGM
ncbi:MAG: DUF2461 family protein [Gammaproteobacteria bacterium]